MSELFEHAMEEHIQTITRLRELTPQLAEVASVMASVIRLGGKVIFMGNGGSAADCQHLAAELVGRFVRERRALAAIALTTDTSILTAVGNDYGYDQVFSRQIEGLCRTGDMVIGISTSGNSPNILAGITAANLAGAITVGLTGNSGGKLKQLCEYCIVVPSTVTARIQEAHLLIGHLWCAWVDSELIGPPAA